MTQGAESDRTDAIIVIDENGTVVVFDARAEALFARSAADVVGGPVVALMPESYHEAHRRGFRHFLETGHSTLGGGALTVEGLRGDGREVPISIRVLEIPSSGDVRLFVAGVSDLRRHRDMREAAWYRGVFQQAMVGIALVETGGKYLWMNQRACDILGYTEDELATKLFQDLVYENAPGDAAAKRRILAGEVDFVATETRFVKKDGVPVWVSLWTRLVRGDAGAPLYFVSIYDDIDARKEAEERDRQTLSLLRATLESTGDGILVVDLEGHVTSYNRRLLEMWKLDDIVLHEHHFEVLNLSAAQLLDQETRIRRLREIYDRPAAESFDVIDFKDGRQFERYSRPQLLGDEVVGRVWNYRDVTTSREAEERLRRSQELLAHAQKMDAMGRLAGGVAHDFNNLLGVITGYAKLLLTRLDEDDPLRRWVKPIDEATKRAAALTGQLLAFSRKQPRKLAELDLNSVVRAVVEMLSRVLGANITVETSLSDDLWPVLVDRGQVEQVIVNLIVNARDAMPDGGTMLVSTVNFTDPSGPRFVRLDVIDSGIGIEPAVVERIFEPFYTTKAAGHGTGLGLSTVHGIVEQSGGRIELDTEPLVGTRFSVFLPPSGGGGVATAPVEEEPPARPSRGGETILVCEDHEELRALVRVILESRGYRVLLASTETEALEAAREVHVDLLVADVVLPLASGPEIYESLKREHPELPVLFVSGYLELQGKAVLAPNAPFLAKPFTPDALAEAVRGALRQSRP